MAARNTYLSLSATRRCFDGKGSSAEQVGPDEGTPEEQVRGSTVRSATGAWFTLRACWTVARISLRAEATCSLTSKAKKVGY
jgi:hypothetical protein